jgi:hypothetical protein
MRLIQLARWARSVREVCRLKRLDVRETEVCSGRPSRMFRCAETRRQTVVQLRAQLKRVAPVMSLVAIPRHPQPGQEQFAAKKPPGSQGSVRASSYRDEESFGTH